jgi:hypothetical protein
MNSVNVTRSAREETGFRTMRNSSQLALLGCLVVTGALGGCGDYSDRVISTTNAAATSAPAASSAAPAASSAAPAASSAAAPASATGAPSAPPEALCEAVTACGGDVVGTWAAKSSCLTMSGNVDMTGFGLGCTTSPATGEFEVTGSWTFGADGMVTDETVTTGNETIALLAECLTVSGTVTACDRIGGALPTIGFTADAVCTDDTTTGGCDCPAVANQMGGAASLAMRPIKTGTYTVADNVISIKDNRNNLNEYSYCVQGDIMIATLKSLPKAGPITGQIVFQRQ